MGCCGWRDKSCRVWYFQVTLNIEFGHFKRQMESWVSQAWTNLKSSPKVNYFFSHFTVSLPQKSILTILLKTFSRQEICNMWYLHVTCIVVNKTHSTCITWRVQYYATSCCHTCFSLTADHEMTKLLQEITERNNFSCLLSFFLWVWVYDK